MPGHCDCMLPLLKILDCSTVFKLESSDNLPSILGSSQSIIVLKRAFHMFKTSMSARDLKIYCLWAWFPHGRKNRVTIFLNGQFIIVYTYKSHINHKLFSSYNHSAYFQF